MAKHGAAVQNSGANMVFEHVAVEFLPKIPFQQLHAHHLQLGAALAVVSA
jgi:hypothetical protein